VKKVIEKHGCMDVMTNIAGVNKRKRVETYILEDSDFVLEKDPPDAG
jgi:hypothetical protein